MKHPFLLIPPKDPFKYSILTRNNIEAFVSSTDFFGVNKPLDKSNSKTKISNFGCGAKFPRNYDALPHI